MNQLLVLLAAVCLGISVFNVFVDDDVRALRVEFQQRQLQINESAGYKDLNDRMIRALANVAANTGDDALREMLSSQGVTFTVNEPGPAQAEAAQAPDASAASETGENNE